MGLACVIQSEPQIAKLLPTVLKCILPDHHNYKEERISLYAENDTSKRYPIKLFQDILPYACCHLSSVWTFSTSGLSETYQMLCQTVQCSMLSLNKMLPSFAFKTLKLLSSRMSSHPNYTQKIRVNQCAPGTQLITQHLL